MMVLIMVAVVNSTSSSSSSSSSSAMLLSTTIPASNRPDFILTYIATRTIAATMKKALRETQTQRAGCSKVE